MRTVDPGLKATNIVVIRETPPWEFRLQSNSSEEEAG